MTGLTGFSLTTSHLTAEMNSACHIVNIHCHSLPLCLCFHSVAFPVVSWLLRSCFLSMWLCETSRPTVNMYLTIERNPFVVQWLVLPQGLISNVSGAEAVIGWSIFSRSFLCNQVKKFTNFTTFKQPQCVMSSG